MSGLPLHHLGVGARQLRSAGDGKSTEDIIKVDAETPKKYKAVVKESGILKSLDPN
jgi:hypothetical protein